jgi:uncharacterized protein (TIRG00374 family)
MIDFRSKSNGTYANIKRIIRILLVVVPLAVCANVIYLVVVVRPDFIAGLIAFNGWYLSLAVALALLPWPAQSLRIFIWSRVLKRKTTYVQCFRTVLAADLGAAISPTILGGGYIKLGFLMSYGFTAAEATLVTFLGTLVDAAFFIVAIPLSISLSRAWENPHVIHAANNLLNNWPTALAIIVLLGIVLVIIRRIQVPAAKREQMKTAGQKPGLLLQAATRIVKFREDFENAAGFILRRGKSAFMAAVLVAGFGWCGRYGAVSALAFGLGYHVDPVLFFLLQWVVFTTMTMVPTPGAIGGAEVSFSLVYRGLIPAEVMPVIMSAWRFLTFYLSIGLGSLVLAATGKSSEQKRSESAASTVPEKAPV